MHVLCYDMATSAWRPGSAGTFTDAGMFTNAMCGFIYPLAATATTAEVATVVLSGYQEPASLSFQNELKTRALQESRRSSALG